MGSLIDMRERRTSECRLTPDQALRTLDEAEAFLRDRGLLTRTADCALPSLYEACHEDPYKPGSPGFATWPATKWPWFGELAGRGYLLTAVHRGKNLLVTGEVARLLDPICRAEIERMRGADAGWRRLLDHLAAAGPSSIEDLRTELGLKRQELKSLRAPLERCGVIVSRSLQVTAGEGHLHSSELARWDQAYAGAGTGAGDCAPRSSRPSPSCGAGSPGSGTGRTRSSMSLSARDACEGRAVRSRWSADRSADAVGEDLRDLQSPRSRANTSTLLAGIVTFPECGSPFTGGPLASMPPGLPSTAGLGRQS